MCLIPKPTPPPINIEVHERKRLHKGSHMDNNFIHNSIHERGHVMEVEKVLHMTSGEGEYSYSHNSIRQVINYLTLSQSL